MSSYQSSAGGKSTACGHPVADWDRHGLCGTCRHVSPGERPLGQEVFQWCSLEKEGACEVCRDWTDDQWSLFEKARKSALHKRQQRELLNAEKIRQVNMSFKKAGSDPTLRGMTAHEVRSSLTAHHNLSAREGVSGRSRKLEKSEVSRRRKSSTPSRSHSESHSDPDRGTVNSDPGGQEIVFQETILTGTRSSRRLATP